MYVELEVKMSKTGPPTNTVQKTSVIKMCWLLPGFVSILFKKSIILSYSPTNFRTPVMVVSQRPRGPAAQTYDIDLLSSFQQLRRGTAKFDGSDRRTGIVSL